MSNGEFHRVARLELILDMETGILNVGGKAPTLELSKAMCGMAYDEFERKIHVERVKQMMSGVLPVNMPLPDKNRG